MKKNKNVLHDIYSFLVERRAWWLLPIVVMLLLVGLLAVFGQESALSPFIYAIF